jgi:hypothetical protein
MLGCRDEPLSVHVTTALLRRVFGCPSGGGPQLIPLRRTPAKSTISRAYRVIASARTNRASIGERLQDPGLCDEWSDAQVKAFRLLVNRSATWAAWDDELLTLELQELSEADYDLSLTGFDPKELDDLLIAPAEDERANATPPLPDDPPDSATCGFVARGWWISPWHSPWCMSCLPPLISSARWPRLLSRERVCCSSNGRPCHGYPV